MTERPRYVMLGGRGLPKSWAEYMGVDPGDAPGDGIAWPIACDIKVREDSDETKEHVLCLATSSTVQRTIWDALNGRDNPELPRLNTMLAEFNEALRTQRLDVIEMAIEALDNPGSEREALEKILEVYRRPIDLNEEGS